MVTCWQVSFVFCNQRRYRHIAAPPACLKLHFSEKRRASALKYYNSAQEANSYSCFILRVIYIPVKQPRSTPHSKPTASIRHVCCEMMGREIKKLGLHVLFHTFNNTSSSFCGKHYVELSNYSHHHLYSRSFVGNESEMKFSSIL